MLTKARIGNNCNECPGVAKLIIADKIIWHSPVCLQHGLGMRAYDNSNYAEIWHKEKEEENIYEVHYVFPKIEPVGCGST